LRRCRERIIHVVLDKDFCVCPFVQFDGYWFEKAYFLLHWCLSGIAVGVAEEAVALGLDEVLPAFISELLWSVLALRDEVKVTFLRYLRRWILNLRHKFLRNLGSLWKIFS
jgi:hypothetical protein